MRNYVCKVSKKNLIHTTFSKKSFYLCKNIKNTIVKILFLTYHGFDPGSGISKKMIAQIKGLRQNGHEVHVCSYSVTPVGDRCRFVDNQVIQNYGRGKRTALKPRLDFDCILKYCIEEHIELVYARSYMNASPPLVKLFKKFRLNGIKSVIEIPTYPYDKEFETLPFEHKARLFIDKMYRKALSAQTNAIVTFSDEKTIFGQRTINISNGVDLDAIPLHKDVDFSKELHLIAVAEVHPWHGFDRLIEGLGQYYQQGGGNMKLVYFHIVGDVWDSEMNDSRFAKGFATHIKNYNIEPYVIFHGKLFGDELNKIFDMCSFAVGSLARHRSGITNIKTLKNREYASRGIPFIYSENDSDFDEQPYIIKAPADDSPIDINRIISFLSEHEFCAAHIRKTVEHLSWKIQMGKVINMVEYH